MRRTRQPWWRMTRSRRSSLALGAGWSGLAVLQAVLLVAALVADGEVERHRVVGVVASTALATAYLGAWYVRGRRESEPGTTPTG